VLDLAAKGRNESPDATQDGVRYHNEYPLGPVKRAWPEKVKRARSRRS
jgi:hypothetical protein